MKIIRLGKLEITKIDYGDFNLKVVDSDKKKTFYVRDDETLSDLLEGEVSEQDSGVTVENWK